MRKLNIEDLKKEFVGKTFNWLTVLDVFRDDHTTIMFKCQCRCGNITAVRKQYVISGHTTSCGCYKCSHEKVAKYTEWCKNNPDKVEAIANKNRQIAAEKRRKNDFTKLLSFLFKMSICSEVDATIQPSIVIVRVSKDVLDIVAPA